MATISASRDRVGAIIIEGHVQGLSNARSLGKSGIPVIVIDKTNCVAQYSKYCRGFYKCPNFDSDGLADFLIELAARKQLKDWVLIPSNDHAVYTISRNKEKLEQWYKVITPGLDIIETIYDKTRLLEIAEVVGVPIPRTVYAKNDKQREEEIGFPVLTKGRQGLDFYKATGRKVFLSRNAEEWRAHLKDISKVFPIERTFTQEVIPFDGRNRTISFAAFCDQGEVKVFWVGEKLREHPIRFGTATCARSMKCEKLIPATKKLLSELRYTGACEVEYLMDPRDGEYKLIEINARTWLWVGLAKACGVDFALYIYRFMLGEKVIYPKEYPEDVVWINYLTDIPFGLISIVNGAFNPKAYFHSIRKKKTDALIDRSDIKPFLAYLLLGFSMIRRR